jgi:hypothetical protein
MTLDKPFDDNTQERRVPESKKQIGRHQVWVAPNGNLYNLLEYLNSKSSFNWPTINHPAPPSLTALSFPVNKPTQYQEKGNNDLHLPPPSTTWMQISPPSIIDLEH